MLELGKKSLGMAKSLGGAIGRGIAWNWDLNKQTPDKVLGQIYETMLKIQEEQDIDHELSMRDEKKKEKKESDRNAALIKALTARRKPKTKKEKKKEEPKKPEEKPPTKPAEKKAPEKKPPEKKEETVKKQVDKESEKAKQQAQKESDKAKKTAEKEQAAAKKKVEQEAKQKAEPVKPPEVKPKAEVTPKASEVKPPSSATKGTKLIPAAVIGAAAAVSSSLASAGVTEKGQANIMAQVKSESGFKPRSENLNYSSAERIQEVFGKGRIPSIEFAKTLVNNPEALANVVYAKTDGNSAPGDGYKYRGRGYLQITGKNAYKSLGQYLKIDLLSNPDLLNTPDIAAKSIPWFFLVYKSYITKGDPKSLENIAIVNKAVGFADKKLSSGEMESEHRKKLAEEFQKENLSSISPTPTSTPPSEKVAGLSKENAELNANLEKQQQTTTVNNVTTSNEQQSTPIKQAKVDDRSPMQRKMQG